MRPVKINKAISLSLAILIALISASSCGQGTVAAPDTSAADTETVTSDAASTKLTAEIPDKKYDGYEFRLLGLTPAETATNDELFSEGSTGDVLNDAVYERNRLAEEKFDIKITKVNAAYSDISTALNKTVLAGEDAYDAVVDATKFVSTGIANDLIVPISELTYIDLDKPWWNKELIESSEINDEVYFLMGDIGYSWKNYTWALCFNKRLFEENGLNDPYEMVRDGKWTMDLLEQHCKNITKDLNGDSKLDKNDQWGLLSSKNAGIGLVTSTGLMTVVDNGAGSFKLNLGSERSVDILGNIRQFMTNNDIQLRAEDIGGSTMWVDIINIFREGRALYRISVISDISGLRDMNDDFGILPMPKYDDQQTDYITTYQSWNGRAFMVPITATDLNRTSAILEYMASVSPDTVTKAYYDVTLQRKVVRDDDSSEMLDIIFSSVITDIGLAYELGDMRTVLTGMINSDTDNISSTIASKQESINLEIQKLVDSLKG